IHPPPSPFEQQLVAEKVRKAGDRWKVAIKEDSLFRKDLAAVTYDCATRHVLDLAVGVEMKLVAMAKKRLDAQGLHGREARADPEALHEVTQSRSSKARSEAASGKRSTASGARAANALRIPSSRMSIASAAASCSSPPSTIMPSTLLRTSVPTGMP